MLDPHTAAELSLDEIASLVDDLLRDARRLDPAARTGRGRRVTGEEKLRREGLPEEAVAAFRALYDQLVGGRLGHAAGRRADAGAGPADARAAARARRRSPRCARAVRDQAQRRARDEHGARPARSRCSRPATGCSFLDVIARQVGALRERHRVRLPLVLMHSFAHARGLARGAGRVRRRARLPPAQGAEAARGRPERGRMARRTRRSSGARPATATSTPRCGPPGRCDTLLEQGIRYAFVSNADNLGAVLDPVILEWFAASRRAVRDGDRDRHRGRPQGRPHRLARRPARAARDRAGGAGPGRVLPATSGAGATTTPTTCGSTWRRWRAGRRPTCR